jgi:hypothetical protein
LKRKRRWIPWSSQRMTVLFGRDDGIFWGEDGEILGVDDTPTLVIPDGDPEPILPWRALWFMGLRVVSPKKMGLRYVPGLWCRRFAFRDIQNPSTPLRQDGRGMPRNPTMERGIGAPSALKNFDPASGVIRNKNQPRRLAQRSAPRFFRTV